MPCANIFHGMAAPILGSHSFMVGWESMRLVTHEAQDPMNRCNCQLPSHAGYFTAPPPRGGIAPP